MRGKSIGLLASILLCAAAGATASPIAVVNPSFEERSPGTVPVGWHTGAGSDASKTKSPYRAVIDTDQRRSGHASVRIDSPQGEIGDSDFGTVINSIDATPYRGRRVRFTGAVRALPSDDGQVGLWLRVDRRDDQSGFFDNMADRPITSANWTDYSIEADVATDAESLVFGMLLTGHGQAWLDDVRLDDVGPALSSGIPVGWGYRPRNKPMDGDTPPRALTERGLVNLRAFARLYGLVRFFHPSDEAAAADWDSLAIAGVERVEAARTPSELAADLRAVFGPVAPSVQIYVAGQGLAPPSRPAEAASATRWHHIGYGDDPAKIYSSQRIARKAVGPNDLYTVALPAGLIARVPLAVWRDAEGRTLPRARPAPLATGKPSGFSPAGFDRETRLAAAVAAWSMFGQFFPYFDAKTRRAWDDTLEPALRSAAINTDDLAFRDTLRRLVARLQDGHGAVPYYLPPTGLLPLSWDWVEDRLVITAAGADAAGLKRGDVVTAIDGVPSAKALLQHMAFESGSIQWTRVRALNDLLDGSPGAPSVLTVDGRKLTLHYGKVGGDAQVRETKPDPIAELSHGLYYVDLDRVTQSEFDSHLEDLAKARGLIFDLRGYPRMSEVFLMHFSDKPVKSGHFVTLAFDRPDKPGVPVHDGQWTLPSRSPRFTRNVVFITDGSAASYAESVLGVIAGNRLADIIGSPSAGANGNITFFTLPGGYQVRWTGMKVTNLDGSRHYLLGIQPTVPTKRTIAGIRAGRDELLDRAVGLVKSRMRTPH